VQVEHCDVGDKSSAQQKDPVLQGNKNVTEITIEKMANRLISFFI